MKYLGPPQSGSQAGTTASHNRHGQYFRSRRTPVTPTRTQRQTTLRSQFGAAATAFQGLTSAQQAAWTAFAHSYPTKDALGQTITLTGQQMFVAIGTSLLNVGKTISNDPPTNVVVNPITPVILYADATGNFWAGFTEPFEGDFILCAQSKLLSGGVSFCKTFTQVGVGVGSIAYFNFTERFAKQWGAITVGRRLFARLTPVNSSGRTGTGIIVSTTAVTAPTLPVPSMAASAAGVAALTWSGGGTFTVVGEISYDGGVTWQVSSQAPAATTGFSFPAVGATNTYRATLTDNITFSHASNTEAGS